MIAMLVEDMLLDLGHKLVAVPILSKAVQPGSSGLCHQRCLRPEQRPIQYVSRCA
jgi:hypothetical protein